ncbi:hypothetical protein RJT34_01811 [Clitoria ternatea]|uniref:Homeobox-leucine zipper protein n=1 Tax=Clitoria ternatea TaxID=43366 RepID=A0AAN9PYP6_CLITE
MASEKKLFGGSSMTILLENKRLPCSSELVQSLWVQHSEPSFQGSKSLVDVVNTSGSRVTDRTFSQGIDEKEENGYDDDDFEACLHQPGKKRRLTSSQIQFLESSFVVENKLEPVRKVQLAKELGMQPRQVAIWFQNRRARFKTKQIEKDYATLKASYDLLKGDYENLLQHNDNLKQEVTSLKNRLIPTEKEEKKLDDKWCNVVNSEHKEHMDLISNSGSENGSKVPLKVICKQEGANSKSDEGDSESSHFTDGNQSSLVGSSQDDQDILSQNLFTVPFLPKVEDVCYHIPPENSCTCRFPVEDQTFCFW